MKRYAFTDMAPCQEEYYLEEHAEGAWVRHSDHEQDLRESREVAARNATDAQHLRQTAVQQAATLERVRAAYDYAGNHWADWGERALTVQEMLDAALASQPKAPLRNGPSDADSMPVCVPEAPKGQGDDPDWQDVAQYSNECPQITDLLSVYEQQRRDLAAAKARIAELEEENARLRDPLREQTWAERFRVITERADAAERHVTEWKKLHGEATKLWREAGDKADQLAARVTSLQAELDIAWADDDPKETCTPEERKVLDAIAAAELGEEDADDVPGEPVEVGEDCYIYTDDQHAIVRAELANRAAKAKRGGT